MTRECAVSETPTADRTDDDGAMSVALPSNGQLVVISGPSGAGKTAVCEALLASYVCERAVTATTRAPREGETHGVDYFFYEIDDFRDEVEEELFLEHAEVYDNLYGTPLLPISAQLECGGTVLLNIDVQGATTLMKRGVPATFVFLDPPSIEELERRLRLRKSDCEEAIQLRLETALSECAEGDRYHYRVVNDKLDDVVAEVAGLLGLSTRSSDSDDQAS